MANLESLWLRWEPHVRAPGAVLNDQFKGINRFEQYFAENEVTIPVIRALSVPDYASLLQVASWISVETWVRIEYCSCLPAVLAQSPDDTSLLF